LLLVRFRRRRSRWLGAPLGIPQPEFDAKIDTGSGAILTFGLALVVERLPFVFSGRADGVNHESVRGAPPAQRLAVELVDGPLREQPRLDKLFERLGPALVRETIFLRGKRGAGTREVRASPRVGLGDLP